MVGALDPSLLDIIREAEASRVTPSTLSALSTAYSASNNGHYRVSDRLDSRGANTQLGALLDSGGPSTGTTCVKVTQSSPMIT